MPLSPDDFYSRAMAAADVEGRMPLSRLTGWEIFPFEPEGLRVVPLMPPVVPEPSRHGEDGIECRGCAEVGGIVWEDDEWRLRTFVEASGAPLVLMLEPKRHFDLVDLPDELARDLGRLVVHVARAVEGLEHVARAHVARWGDGGAHLHVFFFARPEGFVQLRGTCFAIWDDLLPAVPVDVRDADARRVGVALVASFGGRCRDG